LSSLVGREKLSGLGRFDLGRLSSCRQEEERAIFTAVENFNALGVGDELNKIDLKKL
jgi:hypothetical protein